MFKKKAVSRNIRRTTSASVNEEEQVNVIKREDLIEATKKTGSIHGFGNSKKSTRKALDSTNNDSLDSSQIQAGPQALGHDTSQPNEVSQPKGLPFSSLSINPFSNSSIPSAADIYLAKIKRAGLSKKQQSSSTEQDFISLDSSIPRPSNLDRKSYLKTEITSSGDEDEDEDGHISDNVLKTAPDFEQYSLNKLQKLNTKINDEDGYDYEHMEVDTLSNGQDDNPVFELDDSLAGTSLDEIAIVTQKSQTLGALQSRIEDASEPGSGSDNDNVSWEYERLKSSGVDLKLFLKNHQAPYVDQNDAFKSYPVDHTNFTEPSTKKEKKLQTTAIPIPNNILVFIKQIYENKMLDLSDQQSKLSNLNLAIEQSQNKISSINLESEKTLQQIAKFNQLLLDSKNSQAQ